MSLARERRPYEFSDVIEQSTAVAALLGSVNNPSGCYLINGPYGVGKTTLARIFARVINCQAPGVCTKQNPCMSCEAIRAQSNPDIVEVHCAVTRGIDDVRKLIEVSAVYPTFNYRVFILDEAQQLTQPAQSALLKEFEEPRSRSVWMMCTTEAQKLLPAISSRALQLPLTLMTQAGIEETVRRAAEAENVHVPAPIMAAIVDVAEGHARDALSALTVYTRAVSVGGATDLQKLATKILQQSTSRLAFSYIQGIMMQSPDRVFTATLMAEDKSRFLSDVLDILRVLMYKASGSNDLVQSHAYAKQVANTAVHKDHLRALATLFEIHAQGVAQMRQHVMDEQDILDSLAAKSLLV